ncbi:hypothetical protein BN2475_350018 [Paraburkholderia ribeironis]|uniref:Uncharacterized protein n=1 Tax=Paraburkholderia ribeironis TaxID=1247936 RepID=A0A1N7S4N5_9BURK|nr:hypothetical protein BN2475_350018 [Paraburkholderia ribeironis]
MLSAEHPTPSPWTEKVAGSPLHVVTIARYFSYRPLASSFYRHPYCVDPAAPRGTRHVPRTRPTKTFASGGIGAPRALIRQLQCVWFCDSSNATAMPSGFEALPDSGVRFRVTDGAHFAARDESELKRGRASARYFRVSRGMACRADGKPVDALASKGLRTLRSVVPLSDRMR